MKTKLRGPQTLLLMVLAMCFALGGCSSKEEARGLKRDTERSAAQPVAWEYGEEAEPGKVSVVTTDPKVGTGCKATAKESSKRVRVTLHCRKASPARSTDCSPPKSERLCATVHPTATVTLDRPVGRRSVVDPEGGRPVFCPYPSRVFANDATPARCSG